MNLHKVCEILNKGDVLIPNGPGSANVSKDGELWGVQQAGRVCTETCENDQHKLWMQELGNAQGFCRVHSAGPEYTGEVATFCPWCGKLREVELEKQKTKGDK